MVTIVMAKNSTWSDYDFSNQECAVNNSDCTEWLRVTDSNNTDAAKRIEAWFNGLDKMIDNSDGGLNGKIRYSSPAADSMTIYYQGRPRLQTEAS
jgi:hypothetical protein